MEDEQVRQALERGCDRSDIIDVFDVSRRPTFNKQKPACVYDFPLSASNRGERPTDSDRSDRSPDRTDTPAKEGHEQQRLGAVPEQDPDSLGRKETWGLETNSETRPSNESVEDTDQAVIENGADEELRVHLQYAIDALQEVEQAL
ncbi:hypothetical protein ACFQL3_02335 [Natronoarchaeum sp. GCM10025321]